MHLSAELFVVAVVVLDAWRWRECRYVLLCVVRLLAAFAVVLLLVAGAAAEDDEAAS